VPRATSTPARSGGARRATRGRGERRGVVRLPLARIPAGTRQILPGVLEFEDRSPLTFGGKGFLVVGPKYNILVDTPACTPRVIQAVRACGGLRYIFLSHRDEIGELQLLRRALGGAVIAHRSEAQLVRGGADLVFDQDFEVEPGMWVVHTPGHSPGSACLLVHRGELKVLFTGDHVLRRRAGVPAPLKFPWTWDWDAQVASARRLLDLDFDYLVPSHDDRLPHGWFDDARVRLTKALLDPVVTRGAAPRGATGRGKVPVDRPLAPGRKPRPTRS